MFTIKHLKNIMISGGVMLLAAACQKDSDGLGGAGQTLVRIPGSDDTVIVFGVDYKATAQAVNILEISRAPHSAGVLNGETIVKVKPDPALITKINNSRHVHFEALPANAWSLDASVKQVNGLYEVRFGSGEIAQYIKININTSLLDLTKSYAMPFVLTEAVNGVITKGPNTALVQVIIKNQWDGKYAAKGTFYHPVNGPRAIDEDKDLVTAGPNSVICNLGDLGANGYQMVLTINADNSVTITPAGATPNVDMNYGVNKYDPATKAFTLNYAYNTAAPRIVRETITRK
ncbi:BT_3044 domain-containing protein [Chitinophaga sp. NPDC101104]|uniref:BT_3044 domain-containing protein n=1 Tax=Chitinophaga sp. NPDC101104 TaxID=3390561 RepID=UPI003D0436E3